MGKNPEFAKFASDLAQAQDRIRGCNEELIKLSQRFGRIMPRLQRLETPAILSWFGLYNKVKDSARKLDEEIAPNCSQRARLSSKMEVLDDVLSGMIEDLLENGALEEKEMEEMRTALDKTMQNDGQIKSNPALA
jgi:hypothetical protein